jgi:integrase
VINNAPGDHPQDDVPNVLASLQTLVSTLGDDSRSPNTRRAYASAWRTFAKWAGASALPALPASAETVALYLAHLYAGGRKSTTIEQALVAISQKHADADLPSPRTDRQVRRVLQGIQRQVGREPTPKAPLLPEHIERITASSSSGARGLRDRALLTVGFASGLRRSELVALDVDDVRWSDGAIGLRVGRSKTDPRGEGRYVRALARPGSPACPVEALRHWIAVASYPFGQPRPDEQRPTVVQRLSDEQLSERRPRERDGGDSLRAAA